MTERQRLEKQLQSIHTIVYTFDHGGVGVGRRDLRLVFVVIFDRNR